MDHEVFFLLFLWNFSYFNPLDILNFPFLVVVYLLLPAIEERLNFTIGDLLKLFEELFSGKKVFSLIDLHFV